MNFSLRHGVALGLMGCLIACHAALGAPAGDELSRGVRTTEPLPPSEQVRQFQLPPGFEIQLVAAEPDLQKPFNLAFDAAGRLWVTTSVEYPWAAPTNRPGRDRLTILEDFGPDGRARRVTEFADGLNIPIGVYPFRTDDTHWKAIVWSIPYLWLLEDTDGDGRADRRTPLYGPFDVSRDTHGNQASFRRGFDGWLYATHGYNNDSHVTARDGSHVDLNSGNTYRIRLDGSRIEQHTHGQVNPFGLAWDVRGNLYSSDCHTAPLYQLLAGGWYPSFGKPHDGLGFAPVMLEHAHGSTAIDGAFFYEDDLWPAEYRNTFLVGNVMTSRLNRDTVAFHGSTPRATEQPDFLTSNDPWFRPVDTALGPDGALYVADFYNRIIGHYEVPLLHPGRDRERGRIWRVIYTGGRSPAPLRPAALASDLGGLIAEMGSPNLTRRMLATTEIEDRFGASAAETLQKALRSAAPSGTGSTKDRVPELQQVHLLWLLERLGNLDDAALRNAVTHTHSLLRVHAQRILAERGRRAAASPNGPGVASGQRQLSIAALRDSDALVQRCAAEALGTAPDFGNLRPLLDLRASVPAADTHLLYVVRMALRDQLADARVLEAVLSAPAWPEADLRALTEVAVAVQSPQAARFLLKQVPWLPETGSPSLRDALRHAARFAPESELSGLVTQVRTRFSGQTEVQLMLFRAVDEGLQRRGGAVPQALRDWGVDLVRILLDGHRGSTWISVPVDAAPTENPWTFQERRRDDGRVLRALSSQPAGEELTGTLRSPEFTAGAALAFWLCGHDGFPDQPPQHRNFVRLREAGTGRVTHEAAAPRSDVARRITWDTSALAARRVFLEVTDADNGDAYAWIALGDVEGGLTFPEASPRAAAERIAGAAGFAARLEMLDAVPRLKELAVQPGDPDARAAAGKGLARLDPAAAVTALGPRLQDGAEPVVLRERFGITLAEMNTAEGRAPVLAAMRSMPYRVQLRWAVPLCATADGADAFLTSVEKGDASARLLQTASARGRLQRANPPDWQTRFERLTRDLEPMDELRANLITARLNGFAAVARDPAAGHRIFETHCAVCHQIAGAGGLVGPQLTGIGDRGAERLAEDILDPNRNVDRAFRQTLLTLKDGDVQAGLLRREEGNVLVLADAAGQEFSVNRSDVVERKESDQSLMPENFGETLSPSDFNQLLAFLLSNAGGK